jgi:hypothetical protein
MKTAVIALATLWAVCGHAQEIDQPTRVEVVSIRLDETQFRQLCRTILMHGYIMNNSSQYGERRSKEIIERILAEEAR